MSISSQLDRFTIDDLQRAPEDGMRYEVVNGCLFVTPPAAYPHNRLAQHVGLALLAAVPSGLDVLMTGSRPSSSTAVTGRALTFWCSPPVRTTSPYRLRPCTSSWR